MHRITTAPVAPIPARTRRPGPAGAGAALAAARWLGDTAPYPYAQRGLLDVPLPFLTADRMDAVLRPRPGERILEIGPGTGLQSLHVAPQLGPEGRLDVLDIQQEMVDPGASSHSRRPGAPGRATHSTVSSIGAICAHDQRALSPTCPHTNVIPLAQVFRVRGVSREVKKLSELSVRAGQTTPCGSTRCPYGCQSAAHRLSAFALGRVNLSRVPVNRLSALARYGQLSKAQTIERAPEPRRTALLTAVVRHLEAQAVDDALDLFAVLMANRLISPARRASDRERLAMLPQLEKAARILAKASKILTEELDLVAEADADLDVAALWAAVEEAVPRTAVAGAVATVEALVPEDNGSAEAAMREKLALRYNTVRPFLTLLGESEALGAAPAGRRLLKAVRWLPALSRRRVKDRPLLPREVDAELVPAM